MSRGMVSAGIIEPYAEALMSVAQAHDITEKVGEDVSTLLNLLKESEDFKQLLASPIIKGEIKKSVIQQVVSEEIHPYVTNFLMLLVDRRRILFIEGIAKHYQALLRKLNRTVVAEVTATTELSDEQRQQIIQKVQEMTGAQQVDIEIHLNDDLIGGVIIKVGSQVVDASLRGQLRRIANSLMRTAA